MNNCHVMYTYKKRREACTSCSLHEIEALVIALQVETSNAKAPRRMYNDTTHPTRTRAERMCTNTPKGTFTVALLLTHNLKFTRFLFRQTQSAK